MILILLYMIVQVLLAKYHKEFEHQGVDILLGAYLLLNNKHEYVLSPFMFILYIKRYNNKILISFSQYNLKKWGVTSISTLCWSKSYKGSINLGFLVI